MWHLSRNMVILKGMATPCWVYLRNMRWPHDLPYLGMMIMSFLSYITMRHMICMTTYNWEGRVTYPQVDLMSKISCPFFHVIILCDQPLYSFLQCHHPFPSTSFLLYCFTCHGNPPSKWSYNIVGEYLYKLRIPIIGLL